MPKYAVHLILGLRHSRYEGEYAPEVLSAWDEYLIHENPEGYATILKEFTLDDRFSAVRELVVEVDQKVVHDIFKPARVHAAVRDTEKS